MPHKSRLKLLLVIGAVLIVSVLVALNPQWLPQRRTALPKDPELEQAIQDSRTDALPADLVLDDTATLLFSGVRQTREGKLIQKGYISTLSAAELKTRYLDYFQKQSWYTGLNTATVQGEAVLNFTKDFSRLGVSIARTEDGTRLILDYYPILSAFGPQP